MVAAAHFCYDVARQCEALTAEPHGPRGTCCHAPSLFRVELHTVLFAPYFVMCICILSFAWV